MYLKFKTIAANLIDHEIIFLDFLKISGGGGCPVNMPLE